MSVFNEKLWIEHLENDVMHFWKQPGSLGNPIGNFPSFLDQTARPLPELNHFMRMHGRRLYGYLTAYKILGKEEYLGYAKAGFDWLERNAVNPNGGYWSQLTPDGTPVETAITIQDLSYTVFPYVTYYKVTEDESKLQPVVDIIRFILEGPYCRDGVLIDSLSHDYQEVCYFEGETLNLVSLMDFMNLLLIPMTEFDDVIRKYYPEFDNTLERLLDLLVNDYYDAGLFWNDRSNRTDYSAKHVDLGHSSKAFGILFRANRYFARKGKTVKYKDLEKMYPPMLKAATDPDVGWRTDFDHSATSFRPDSVQWWRYIMINQTAALYAAEYPELRPLLEHGIKKWFELPFVDRERSVRGIRDGLKPDGSLWGNDDSTAFKANQWKSAYHEVEHVEELLKFLRKNNL